MDYGSRRDAKQGISNIFIRQHKNKTIFHLTFFVHTCTFFAQMKIPDFRLRYMTAFKRAVRAAEDAMGAERGDVLSFLLPCMKEQLDDEYITDWITEIFKQGDPNSYRLNSIRATVNKILQEIADDKDLDSSKRLAAINNLIRTMDVTDTEKVSIELVDYSKAFPEDDAASIIATMQGQSKKLEEMLKTGNLVMDKVMAVEGFGSTAMAGDDEEEA